MSHSWLTCHKSLEGVKIWFANSIRWKSNANSSLINCFDGLWFTGTRQSELTGWGGHSHPHPPPHPPICSLKVSCWKCQNVTFENSKHVELRGSAPRSLKIPHNTISCMAPFDQVAILLVTDLSKKSFVYGARFIFSKITKKISKRNNMTFVRF